MPALVGTRAAQPAWGFTDYAAEDLRALVSVNIEGFLKVLHVDGAARVGKW